MLAIRSARDIEKAPRGTSRHAHKNASVRMEAIDIDLVELADIESTKHLRFVKSMARWIESWCFD